MKMKWSREKIIGGCGHYGEAGEHQPITGSVTQLNCCQPRVCAKRYLNGVHRKFKFLPITKLEMKNTGNHTYTGSHSEHSHAYLPPRGKSSLWARKGQRAFLNQSSVTNSCTYSTGTGQQLLQQETQSRLLWLVAIPFYNQAPLWGQQTHYATLHRTDTLPRIIYQKKTSTKSPS